SILQSYIGSVAQDADDDEPTVILLSTTIGEANVLPIQDVGDDAPIPLHSLVQPNNTATRNHQPYTAAELAIVSQMLAPHYSFGVIAAELQNRFGCRRTEKGAQRLWGRHLENARAGYYGISSRKLYSNEELDLIHQ